MEGSREQARFGGHIHRDPVSATWGNLGIEVQHRRVRAILNMIRFEWYSIQTTFFTQTGRCTEQWLLYSKLSCAGSFTDSSSQSQSDCDLPSAKMLLHTTCATPMAKARRVQATHCRGPAANPVSLLAEDTGREHLEGKRKHEEEEDQLCGFPVDHPLHGECLYIQTFPSNAPKHNCYLTILNMVISSNRHH